MPVAQEAQVNLSDMLAGLSLQAQDLQRQMLATAQLSEEAQARLDALPDLFLNVGARTAQAIANRAITGQQIAQDAVDTVHMIEGAVNGVILANGAVNTQHIAAAAIGVAQIGVAAIRTAAIRNLAVISAKIASVDAGLINAGTINVAVTLSAATITGGQIDIGGTDSTSFHVNTVGQLWLGAGTYAAAPFRVNNDGTTRIGNGATNFMEITAATGGATWYVNGSPYVYISTDTLKRGLMMFRNQTAGRTSARTALGEEGAVHLVSISDRGPGVYFRNYAHGNSGGGFNHCVGVRVGSNANSPLTATYREIIEFLHPNGTVPLVIFPQAETQLRFENGAGSLIHRIYSSSLQQFVIRNESTAAGADLVLQCYSSASGGVTSRMVLDRDGFNDLVGSDWRMPNVPAAGGSPDDLTISTVNRTINFQASSMALKTDVTPISAGEAWDWIRWAEPFWYRTNQDWEDDPFLHPGLGAEPAMAAGFERMVQMRRERPGNKDGDHGGWVPGSIKYKRLPIVNMVALKDLDASRTDHAAQLADLASQVAALTATVEALTAAGGGGGGGGAKGG